MYSVKTYNKIANNGIAFLESKGLKITSRLDNPEAIVLRSHSLKQEEMGNNLLAIGRAGMGVDNIPLKICSKKGIVVLNTPGANANAVKELVIASLLLSSRKIHEGINCILNLNEKKKEDISKSVEQIKKEFAGQEIANKTLGVIGLGAIGVKVAEAALALGMEVMGYDPYMSVKNAWDIPSHAKQSADINEVLKKSDYLTFHIPSTPSTKEYINDSLLSKMKEGVKLLNFSRRDIVCYQDLIKSIKEKKIAYYITDFVDEKLIGLENTLLIPHLGASTKEAENNCALMACEQIYEYLLTGNITNSVNLPSLNLFFRENCFRLTVIHDNVPKMINFISKFLGQEDLNIVDMVSQSRDDIAYTVIDLQNKPSKGLLDKISNGEGIRKIRLINNT